MLRHGPLPFNPVDNKCGTAGKVRLGGRSFRLMLFIAVTLTRTFTAASISQAEGMEDFVLVTNGQPSATIVLPKNATITEDRAADELRDHILQISRAEVMIVHEPSRVEGRAIYVGRTVSALKLGVAREAGHLLDDGFVIHCETDRMILRGKDDLGTLYSVYEVLERLGMRWFNPDPLGIVTPKEDSLSLPSFRTVQQPSFCMRWIGSGEWSMRNRMNVKLPGEMGLKLNAAAHTWKQFVPPSQDFADHPEFFALVRGTRRPMQLCTANPSATNAVVEGIEKYLDKNPKTDVITLFPNDGLGFCECPLCVGQDEGLGPSVQDINEKWRQLDNDRYHALARRMSFHYYAVAQIILGRYPQLLVQCGLYNPYLFPPRDLPIKMPTRVLGEICHQQCHNHSIADEGCEFNRAFKRGVEAWLEVYPRLTVYEYYYKVASLELPFPILHSIRRDLRYYRDKRFWGFVTQRGTNWWTIGLNYYVAAKLLWNADADVDGILDDFYKRFYGAAWEPMKRYHESLEAAILRSGVHTPSGYTEWTRIFTDEVLNEADSLLEQAIRLARNESAKLRIGKQRIVMGYTRLCMEYVRAVDRFGKEHACGGGMPNMTEMMEEMGPYVQRILSYLNRYRDSHCFPEMPTSYQRRLLDPVQVMNDQRQLELPEEKR